MSYENAIKTRKEEIAILRKRLRSLSKVRDKEKIEEVTQRISGLKDAIDELKKKRKGVK